MSDIVYPTSATICVTSACTQHCQFCLWHSNQAVRPNLHYNIKLKDFNKEVDILVDNGVKSLHICGTGEPFLHKDIIPMLRYIRKKAEHASVMSNFSVHFSKKLKETARIDLDEVVTNLDSGDPFRFEEIRKGSDWEVVMSNIHDFKFYNKGRTRLGAWCILMKSEINTYPELIRVCKEIGIDVLKFSYLIPVDMNPLTSPNNVIKGTDTEYLKKIEDIKKLAKKVGLEIMLPPLRSDPNVKNCRALWNFVMVNLPHPDIPKEDWIGNVGLHCFLAHFGKAYSFGNMLKQPFKEIWNCDKINELRKYQDKEKICQECPNR